MENSRGKQNGMIWGLWLSLSVLGGLSVYYYPLFVLTMLVVPAVWAAMAFRTHPILLAAVAGIVFLFGCFMGYDVMSCLGMAAPAGCCLWYSQKENLGNFQSVLYVSVLMTFGLFLVFCVPDLVATGDPYASIRAYFAGTQALFADTPLYDTAVAMVGRINEMMIACFYAFAALYALVNVLLLHAFNKGKKDMPLCPLGPFGTWSAPYGYVMIAGGLCLLATILTVSRDTPMVSTLSLLLYEMWAMPLLLTGVNALYALLLRRLPGSQGKVAFGVLLGAGLVFFYLIFQMVLLLLGFVGVVRRRRAGKERR